MKYIGLGAIASFFIGFAIASEIPRLPSGAHATPPGGPVRLRNEEGSICYLNALQQLFTPIVHSGVQLKEPETVAEKERAPWRLTQALIKSIRSEQGGERERDREFIRTASAIAHSQENFLPQLVMPLVQGLNRYTHTNIAFALLPKLSERSAGFSEEASIKQQLTSSKSTNGGSPDFVLVYANPPTGTTYQHRQPWLLQKSVTYPAAIHIDHDVSIDPGASYEACGVVNKQLLCIGVTRIERLFWKTIGAITYFLIPAPSHITAAVHHGSAWHVMSDADHYWRTTSNHNSI